MLRKKKNNLIVILIVTLILVSSLLTAVLYLLPLLKESYKTQEVKKIYFAENITAAHAHLINQFNKLNKGNVEVIPINLPYEKFGTNKRKELITKNLRNRTSRIDIYAIDIVWSERFNKWAEPLNNYFSEEELKELLPKAKYYCYSDADLFSVPFFLDVGVLYYREDLIKEGSSLINKVLSGITWEDIQKYNFTKSKYKYIFQADSYEGLMCNLIEFIGQQLPTDKNGKPILNKDILPKVSYIRELINQGNIIPQKVVSFNENSTLNYALTNDIPFFRGWATGKKNIKLKSQNDSLKLKKLEFAPLPRFQESKSVSTIGGWNLFISKNCKYKKEAVAFIRFLLSEKSQEYLLEKGDYLPVRKNFYTTSLYQKKYPELKLFYKLINNGVYRIKHSKYTKISDILTKNLNLYFRNSISLKEFIKKSDEEFDLILEIKKNDK